MKFKQADLETVSLMDLIEIMDFNKNLAVQKVDELKKLRQIIDDNKNYVTAVTGELEQKEATEKSTDEENDDFEDEVDFYLSELNNLTKDNIEEKITQVLPVRKNYNYERIIVRLQLEAVKEIKDILELLHSEEENISKEELEQFKEEIEFQKQKIALLKKALQKEKEEEKGKEENKLIFVPTASGNIRILSELEKIPSSYHDNFRELFLSIKDGTFKNVKRFNNNRELIGICEVKGLGTRVLFTRLGKNTYAVITAFLKKTTKDKGYMDLMKRKISSFNVMENFLRQHLDDEEFLKLNEEYERELFNILGTEDAIENKKVKIDG